MNDLKATSQTGKFDELAISGASLCRDLSRRYDGGIVEDVGRDNSIDEQQRKWADICPYTWRIKEDDPMILEILDSKTDDVLMRIFVGAVLEASGRTAILEHCMELENSPWIESWHETDQKAVWKILKR